MLTEEDALILEDWSFDEAMDLVAPMTSDGYLIDVDDDDDEHGFRTLLERPEALSKSLLRQIAKADDKSSSRRQKLAYL